MSRGLNMGSLQRLLCRKLRQEPISTPGIDSAKAPAPAEQLELELYSHSLLFLYFHDILGIETTK